MYKFTVTRLDKEDNPIHLVTKSLWWTTIRILWKIIWIYPANTKLMNITDNSFEVWLYDDTKVMKVEHEDLEDEMEASPMYGTLVKI